ncbi:hypothetical protein CW304_16845 [Bacillus sp. UFRGS-B20]|nr:hypothetical protein CW304_16845 [Bacillus sp. UFRGS-B20]
MEIVGEQNPKLGNMQIKLIGNWSIKSKYQIMKDECSIQKMKKTWSGIQNGGKKQKLPLSYK